MATRKRPSEPLSTVAAGRVPWLRKVCRASVGATSSKAKSVTAATSFNPTSKAGYPLLRMATLIVATLSVAVLARRRVDIVPQERATGVAGADGTPEPKDVRAASAG